MLRGRFRDHSLRNRKCATTKLRRIAVQHTAIRPGMWCTHAVLVAWHRREVEHDNRMRLSVMTRVRQHGLLAIVDADPAEPRRIMIATPET